MRALRTVVVEVQNLNFCFGRLSRNQKSMTSCVIRVSATPGSCCHNEQEASQRIHSEKKWQGSNYFVCTAPYINRDGRKYSDYYYFVFFTVLFSSIEDDWNSALTVAVNLQLLLLIAFYYCLSFSLERSSY
jgi:hypothetical protein